MRIGVVAYRRHGDRFMHLHLGHPVLQSSDILAITGNEAAEGTDTSTAIRVGTPNQARNRRMGGGTSATNRSQASPLLAE